MPPDIHVLDENWYKTMKEATRERLARVAKDRAMVPFHGAVDGQSSNLAPIVEPFPTWSVQEADGYRYGAQE